MFSYLQTWNIPKNVGRKKRRHPTYICANLILQNLEILLFEILLPNKIKSNSASCKKNG